MHFVKVLKLNFLSVSILTQRIQKKLFLDWGGGGGGYFPQRI